MGGFLIDLMILVTIRSPMNIDVQGVKVAVCSDLHREIDTPVDTIHMVTEAFQLLRSTGPDDHGVIHTLEAGNVLMGCLVKSHFLTFLHGELCNCHENLKLYVVIL